MTNIEILIDKCFPKMSQEDIEICLIELIVEGNKESKKKQIRKLGCFFPKRYLILDYSQNFVISILKIRD